MCYYWPPCGGITVVRNVKFVKFFREFGWEPVVYAPLDPNYYFLDDTSFKDIPEGVVVLKTPAREPFGLFNLLQGKKKGEKVKDVFLVRDKEPGLIHKLGICVRGNFFIPDARMLWIKPSVKYLSKYIKENKIDAIISAGPPHSMHRIALALSKKFNIPYIADFGDPWTQIDYFEKFMLTDFAREKHKKQEQEVLKNAGKVVIVSPTWADDMAKLSGRPVDCIPTGYDLDDFKGIEPVNGGKFTICHFGTLGIDRNPDKLWKALAELANEAPGFREDFQIMLGGSWDYTIPQDIEGLGMKENLKCFDALSRDEIMARLLGSGIQLLLINKGFGDYNIKGRIPAKVFEYMGSKKPILTIGPPDSDVAQIVAETATGVTCNYEDKDGLKQAVLTYYKAWKEGKELLHPKNIEKYSFRNLTGKMAGLLNDITSKVIGS